MSKQDKKGLIDRLNLGPVICAEGFLFEIERRGYMSSGEFVPMVSLDHPEALEYLHTDVQHAGCILYTFDDAGDTLRGDLEGVGGRS